MKTTTIIEKIETLNRIKNKTTTTVAQYRSISKEIKLLISLIPTFLVNELNLNNK